MPTWSSTTGALDAEAEEVVAKIRKLGRESIAVKADIALPEENKALFSQVKKKFGRVDVLVNNAGLADGNIWNAKLEDITRDMWLRVFSVDVFGAFDCAQNAVEAHAERRRDSQRLLDPRPRRETPKASSTRAGKGRSSR